MKLHPTLAATLVLVFCAFTRAAAIPAHLDGELPAEAVLNGQYPYPPSPAVPFSYDTTGLATARLSKVPAPGVHPRILLSPEDLPDLRRRLTETVAGKALLATLRERTTSSLLKPGAWENDVYSLFAAGDTVAALKIIGEKRKPSFPEGHYQPNLPYALVMESFDTMVSEPPTSERSRKVAAAIAGWAKAVEPYIDSMSAMPLSDDVWRAKLAGPTTGDWSSDQGMRDLMGNHLMGYAYDFAYNAMTDGERAQVRRVISKSTKGKVWLGARLPHHFRNWNWVAVGLGQPLLALAIEGEEGYDERVYKLGVEIARDYLTYGISPAGCSTEAVGYTQFGFVWGEPFMVAASRRGEPLIAHSHHRAMIDWYLHSLEPAGGQWQSHGDGGDTGPQIHVLSMWKYFYPNDAKIAVLWNNFVAGTQDKPYAGRFHIIEPLLFADDLGPDLAKADAASLKLPNAWFDPARGSLNVRSDWSVDAASAQFECRPDSVGASHEHADRGNFTFSALGRIWAKDNFRSIETRHHNSVLIDGKGQGFWPGPGRFLGQVDLGYAVAAACDAKDAYDWFWPKQILAEDPGSFPRFSYPRWATYKGEAEQFQQLNGGLPIERDLRPAVVAHWKDFVDVAGGPRLWDEDSWPVRLPFNTVSKAYRTIVFVRLPQPYMLVVDDIQKDSTERLYEWTMQTGLNTEVVSTKDNDIVLCDATVPRDADGKPKLAKGTRQLVVRTLESADPALPRDLNTKPSARLEAFERKDTTTPNGRSFGADKRLVLPSRSAEPRFKVLLLPTRAGDPVPETTWSADKTTLTMKWGSTTDTFTFNTSPDGRTRVSLSREAYPSLPPIEETK